MQREQGAAEVSRREVALAGLSALSLAAVRPAQAGLLGGPSDNEIYSSDTVSAVLGPAPLVGASSILASKQLPPCFATNSMVPTQVAHACSLGRGLAMPHTSLAGSLLPGLLRCPCHLRWS